MQVYVFMWQSYSTGERSSYYFK